MRIRLVLYLEDSTNYCLPFCFTQDSCRSPLKSFLAEISYRHQGAPLCQAQDQAAMTCTARVYTRKYSQLRLPSSSLCGGSRPSAKGVVSPSGKKRDFHDGIAYFRAFQ